MSNTVLNDYERQLERVNNIPHFRMGQEVDTEFGKGIIVHMEMQHNGLYIEPYGTQIRVWFSTAESKGGWVNTTFSIRELAKLNYGIDYVESELTVK